MRKIVAGFAASVDGYIEGPNGEHDWILIDKAVDFLETFKRFDAFLFGRKTYEKALLLKSPAMPGMATYVISNTLDAVARNHTLLKGTIKEQITQLKAQKGKDLFVFGGAGLLTSLLQLKLVDEIAVSVIPVLLGRGKPMIDALDENIGLALTQSETFSNGTVQLRYNVVYKTG